MTSKYKNKNGEKKLLAAILVMALAFAGCAMVIGSDESDATISGPVDITESLAEAESTVSETGTFKVTSDKTVTITAASGGLEFYVADKVTLTLKAGENCNAEVTVYTADSKVEKKIDDDTNIMLEEFNGGEISVKALYSGSKKVSSSLVISGAPDVTSITATVGEVTDGAEGSISIGSSGFSTGTAITIGDINYGSMSTDSNKNKYTEPNSNQSYTISDTEVITIMSGTVIVTDGNNTIKFSKYKAGSTPATITGTELGMKVKGGSGDSGSISILKGTVTKDGDSGLESAAGTFTGVCGDNKYQAQITEPGTYTVYGDYEQKKSVENDAVAMSVTLNSEATFVVPEGIKMEITTLGLPSGAVIKVFGELDIAAASETIGGKIQVGPYGVLGTATPDANTNVASGDDNGRSGELTGVVEDIILTGNAIVPAGKVLTVNGNLGLSGYTLTVEGKVVISEEAVVYTLGKNAAEDFEELVILKGTGTIENNGVLGTVEDLIVKGHGSTDKITLSGVTGAQFGYVTINGNKVLSVFGDVTTNGLKRTGDDVVGTITMNGNAAVGGDLTIGEGVTFTGVEGTNVSSGAHMTVEGTLSGEITLQAGAYIQIDGEIKADALNKTVINAIQGKIDGSGIIAGDVKLTVSKDKATGFAIYSEKTKTEVEVYISGEIEDANLPTDDSTNVKSELSITGTIVIPKAGLSVSDKIEFTVSAFILEGVMQDSSNANSITGFVGAKYVTEAGTGSNKVTTTYYTDIATAMAAIDSAKDRSVSIKVENLRENIVVADKQKLSVDIKKVALGASITAENGSELAGDIDEIVGSVVIFNNAKCDMELADIAAASIPSTDKTIYAGFETAVGMVGAGETLTVGTVVTEADLVIKEGVAVVAENLTVKGNLTIPTSSALKAQSITMLGTEDKKVTVYGTLDLSEGNISGAYKLTSPGTTVLSSIDTAKMSGAYYVTETGYVLTSVSKAASQATDGEVIIIGNEVSETADVVLDGIDLRISSNATKTTIGKIVVLNGAKVIAQGELKATITDAVPITLGTITSTVSVNGSVITVTGSEDGLQINAVSGKVRVVEGIVTVTGAVTVAEDAEFSVSEGAQAVVAGSMDFEADSKLDVQGYLSVKGTLKVADQVKIAGTLSALTGSNVTFTGGADIVGTLAAEADSSVTTNSNITVRDGATVSGEITLGTNYVKAYAGADVKDMEIDGVPFSAEFYANDLLIVTFYATSPITVDNIDDGLVEDVKAAISGADVGTTILWKDSDGGNIGETISSDSKYYVDLTFKKIGINVSVQNGTELRIGTDYYTQTCSTEPIYYLETPYEISATDLLGNRDVTIEFYVDDVKQEISGGKITFTADMEDKKIVIFSSCGSAPVTPVAPVESDDGMELTDYLLIVLVVLAAILVVVVAIRMMRS